MLLLVATVFAQAPAPVVEPAPIAEPAPAVAAAPAIDPSDLIGAPAGPPVTGEALREKTHAIAKLMRCPVCQGLSVADSRSESALAMKDEVQDLVAQGYDADQVLLYFEASYGEFIRLEPKFEGVNLLVWGAPLLLLLGGGGWIFWSVFAAGRRRSASPSAPTVSLSKEASAAPSPSSPEDDALAAYLRRVREESR
ncbi:MAG: cytochrome c-type biogenesis protein CcmH [Pseudomonadota bacterium]|nr:cytochrome c-type biogenesis protein CcmH [Pseudomonadota bacterium]